MSARRQERARLRELAGRVRLRFLTALFDLFEQECETVEAAELGREIMEAAVGRAGSMFAATMAVAGDQQRETFIIACKADYDAAFYVEHNQEADQ